MSTEWLQIVLTLAIVVPLIVCTGRYLYWRQWDRERRAERLAKRRPRTVRIEPDWPIGDMTLPLTYRVEVDQ